MPPSVNRSNAKHYSEQTVTEYKEFAGRSHWTCAEPGWEAIADYALAWAVEKAERPGGAKAPSMTRSESAAEVRR
jgi:hypothetical protein